jgi:co-chaperonin GroES (HSP10)
MLKITPTNNNCILKLIENDEKIGSIIIAKGSIEKPTLAEVIIPPLFSYHPNGDLKDSVLKTGMRVRLPKGQVGTGMPEAPEGETWLCVPEDIIYYITEEI